MHKPTSHRCSSLGFPMKLIMMLLSVNGPHDRRAARHVSQRAHYISLVQHSNNVYTC